jgi:hypothetical protein
MERQKASDYPQELLDLFHEYQHGDITRRAFFDRAAKFAVGGLTVTAIWVHTAPSVKACVASPTSRVHGDGSISCRLTWPPRSPSRTPSESIGSLRLDPRASIWFDRLRRLGEPPGRLGATRNLSTRLAGAGVSTPGNWARDGSARDWRGEEAKATRQEGARRSTIE